MTEGRVCVIYHYYEADLSYRDNLVHFLKFGIIPDVDYFMVISGNCSIGLPNASNITYVSAPNRNHDYGGHSFALHRAVPVDSYDYFIFVNSSVRGPYLPAYVRRPWCGIFLNLLGDDVGLVGSTINIMSDPWFTEIFRNRYGGPAPYSHVQSMAFAMSKHVLLQLFEANLFNGHEGDIPKSDVIVDYEILMSQTIIRSGWNIRCLLPEYNVVDYRKPHVDVNPASTWGDPWYEGAYCGRTIHPFEAMFVKTNRNIYPPNLLEKITHSMACG